MGHDNCGPFLKGTDLKFMSLKLFSSWVVCFGTILFTTFTLFKRAWSLIKIILLHNYTIKAKISIERMT